MAGKKSWKKLLENVKALFAEARVNLHAITVLLVKIWEDKDFRHDAQLEDDYAASDWIDEYITDTDLTFLELRAVLVQFPKEEQWKESTIRDLYAQTKKTTEEQAEAPPVNRTAWKKKAEEAEEKLKETEFQNIQLKKVESDSLERLTDQSQEIRNLKEENAVLRGRIEELERLYKPELAAA